jgi:hypothetical protein
MDAHTACCNPPLLPYEDIGLRAQARPRLKPKRVRAAPSQQQNASTRRALDGGVDLALTG